MSESIPTLISSDGSSPFISAHRFIRQKIGPKFSSLILPTNSTCAMIGSQPHYSATTFSTTTQPSPLRSTLPTRHRRLIRPSIYLSFRPWHRTSHRCGNSVPTHITRGRSVRPTPFSTFCIRPQPRCATHPRCRPTPQHAPHDIVNPRRTERRSHSFPIL